VLATVSARIPDRGEEIIDAGALAMSKDTSPGSSRSNFGYGIVCDLALRPMRGAAHRSFAVRQ